MHTNSLQNLIDNILSSPILFSLPEPVPSWTHEDHFTNNLIHTHPTPFPFNPIFNNHYAPKVDSHLVYKNLEVPSSPLTLSQPHPTTSYKPPPPPPPFSIPLLPPQRIQRAFLAFSLITFHFSNPHPLPTPFPNQTILKFNISWMIMCRGDS